MTLVAGEEEWLARVRSASKEDGTDNLAGAVEGLEATDVPAGRAKSLCVVRHDGTHGADCCSVHPPWCWL